VFELLEKDTTLRDQLEWNTISETVWKKQVWYYWWRFGNCSCNAVWCKIVSKYGWWITKKKAYM
jgi:hypothetical protein